jgi:hypothetical protein
MMRNLPLVLVSLLAAASIVGCNRTAPEASQSAPAEIPAATSPAETRTVSLEELPVQLRNPAFEYYGLGNEQPVEMEMRAGAQTFTGTMRTRFLGMRDGEARFAIERTGGLASIGDMEVALTGDGIHVLSSTAGKLSSRTVEMPADLTPGRTWEERSVVETPQGSKVEHVGQFKVVRTERVKTKAGEHDALLITSTGTMTQDGRESVMETKGWYVQGRGPVKLEIVSRTDGQPPAVVTIEESG